MNNSTLDDSIIEYENNYSDEYEYIVVDDTLGSLENGILDHDSADVKIKDIDVPIFQNERYVTVFDEVNGNGVFENFEDDCELLEIVEIEDIGVDDVQIAPCLIASSEVSSNNLIQDFSNRCRLLNDNFYQKEYNKKINDSDGVIKSGKSRCSFYECSCCARIFNKKSALIRHIFCQHRFIGIGLYICYCCHRKFRAKYKLRRHIFAEHVNKKKPMTHECTYCRKLFSTSSSLSRHKKSIHSTSDMQGSSSSSLFECDHCSDQFNRKDSLKCHINKMHLKKPLTKQVHDKIAPEEKRIHCVLCSECFPTKLIACSHLEQRHNIKMNTVKLKFESEQEFRNWKKTIENANYTYYVKNHEKRGKRKARILFCCHRSGNFQPKSDRRRRLKYNGSKKLNAYCPSEIVLKKNRSNNGSSCTVLYRTTHVGHSVGQRSELDYIRFDEDDRRKIADRIASGLPLENILKETSSAINNNNNNNDFNDNINNNFNDININNNFNDININNNNCYATYSSARIDKLKTLERKDLYNIVQSYKLSDTVVATASSRSNYCDNKRSSNRRINELIPEESDETIIRYYKRTGQSDKRFPNLHADDVLVVLMTDTQKALLRNYGHDIIAMDGTDVDEQSDYKFKLYVLLIVDDRKQACPVAFAISNRTDDEILIRTFLLLVITTNDERVIPPTPRIFISDMRETFYNGWLNITTTTNHNNRCLQGDGDRNLRRLFFPWHVAKRWKRHFAKLKPAVVTINQRTSLKRQIENLLEEPNEEVFHAKLVQLFDEHGGVNPYIDQFLGFFHRNYVETARVWAPCYDVSSSAIDATNIAKSVSSFHKTLVGWLARKKHFKRLFTCVEMLLQYVRTTERNLKMQKIRDELYVELEMLRRRHDFVENAIGKRSWFFQLIVEKRPDERWLVPSLQRYNDDDNDNNDNINNGCNRRCSFFVVYKIIGGLTCNSVVNNCQLYCDKCDACSHEYKCSCPDHIFRSRMCVHIHLLCLFRKYVSNNVQTSALSSSSQQSSSSLLVQQQSLPISPAVAAITEQNDCRLEICGNNNSNDGNAFTVVDDSTFIQNITILQC